MTEQPGQPGPAKPPAAAGLDLGASGLPTSSDPSLSSDETSLMRSALTLEASGPGGAREPIEGHDRFATGELAIVCSHYELGVITAVREVRRGSRRAPKAILQTGRGVVLVKRRAAGRDAAGHVAFSHAVHERLAGMGFPLAGLIRTRQGAGAVVIAGGVYEVFAFVQGARYVRSEAETVEAGRVLAMFHKQLGAFAPAGQPQPGSFHGSAVVTAALAEIPARLGRDDLAPVCRSLALLYETATARVRAQGIASWPRQVIHCDYHPGNLLYRDGAVCAVLDLDACRIGPRAIDVANGAMQFSVTRAGADPEQWPVEPDLIRLGAFIRGYDGVGGCVLSRAELRALPWLMTEALIAEATLPIAMTGRFGAVECGALLRMVERKAGWLAASHERIARL